MREIIKRDGTAQGYAPQKIITAMEKVFASTQKPIDHTALEEMLAAVESDMRAKGESWQVEDIQDAVEQTLMANGYYKEAKRYILYRQKRTELRQARQAMLS